MPFLARAPKGQPQRLRSFTLNAPIGGDDTVSPGLAIPAQRSILSQNLIGAEMGLRSRLGWREWAVLGTGEQVRSVLPYTGSTKDGASNRLFVCTQSGIWDVSAAGDQSGNGTAPVQVVTFGTQDADSGWGVSTVFVNTANNHFLCYCDESNGYHVYDESGGTWTVGGLAGTPVTGADPAKLVAVTPWKNRLWFVERDTAKGWYLDIGAVTGAAVSFNFGSRFQRGGDLRCLASWTSAGDGGQAIDDRLVAISGGGDVLVYVGTDPALPGAFGLQGVWYAGQPPVGRRLTTDNGGELLYMSSLGVMSLATLTAGNSALDRRQYQTYQVSNLFNQMQQAAGSLRGWAMRIHPQDSALMVLAPTAAGQPSTQLVMSLITKGWHRYRDMPIGVCAEPWGGTLYCGTEDGRVIVNDGYLDGVLLADPSSYSPINWSLLTAYSNLGSPQWKRVQAIDVEILSQGGAIPLSAEARYDLDLSEAAPPPAAPPGSGGAATWDDAKWDEDKWAGAYQVQRQRFGAYGGGRSVALAIRGAATSRMTLVDATVHYEVGGMR